MGPPLDMPMPFMETGIMLIFWDRILQRFQQTSLALQSSKLDLNAACDLYTSLLEYIRESRSAFQDFEEKAKILCGNEDYKISRQRKGKRNHKFVDSASDTETEMRPSDKFRVETFIVIIDSLSSVHCTIFQAASLQKIGDAYGLIHKVKSVPPDELRQKSANLVESYPEGLEECLGQELVHLQGVLQTEPASNMNKEDERSFESCLYSFLLTSTWLGHSQM